MTVTPVAAVKTTEYQSSIRYFDQSSLGRLPTNMRDLVKSLEVSLAAESALQAQVSCIDDWLFFWIEGHGRIHMRDAVAENISGSYRNRAAEYVTFILVLNGQNRAKDSTMHLPMPGEMVLIPWTYPSGIISTGKFRYLVAHVPVAGLEQYCDKGIGIPYGRPVSALVGAGAVLAAALRIAASEASRSFNRGTLSLIRPQLAQLIVSVFEARDAQVVDQPEAPERVARVRNYLEAHLADEGLSVADAARACGLSERQLFRAFSNAGQKFSKTLQRIRIDKARDLLTLHPAMPIIEVALSSGFASAANFSRVFHEVVGSTPTAYRHRQLVLFSRA